MRGLSYCIGVAVILCIAAVAWADPIVTLNPDQSCYEPGDTVTVTIDLTGSGFPNIVGGQFFLEFTSANLTYVSAVPGSPWTVEVYEYVTSNQINYAVGIPDGGTGATSGTMATLTFTAGAQICDTASLVSFRSGANPPTRLGDVNDVEYSVPKANLTLNALGEITIDNTDPTISGCPGNIAQSNDAGLCSAVVTWTPPTASDNCPGVTLTSSHDPGDVFPVGVTTVTYTAEDACGNMNAVPCSFTVTVTDDEDPVISGCPGDIAQSNDAGACSAVVTWTAPTAADNCGIQSFTSNYNPGDTFPVGTTHVVYTATDIHSNSVTCEFDVTVNDTEDPTISCPGTVTQTANPGVCYATGVSLGTPTTGDNCGVDTVTNDAPAQFPVGDTTVTWTVTDIHGNDATCTQTVTVTDDEDPEIFDCPSDISVNADAGLCSAVVTWTAPTADDNCGIQSFTSDYEPGDTFPGGSTTVTYTATDIHGNVETCSFNVEVSAYNELVLDLDLVDMGASGTLTRCITFELFDCGGGSEVVTQDVTFTNGAADAATVLVPCGAYDCITVRDALHTLRRTDDDTGSFLIVGAQYTADFTGGIGGKALIGGNLNDDDFIDILDFTIYVNRWNVTYDSNGDLTADGNTPCGWTPTPQGPYHADLTGDGRVLTNDFTFVQTYFLYEREANCCGLPDLSSGGPRTAVSVEELQAMGLGTAADLDGDGWVDEVDIVAFANGDRPPAPPVPPTVPKKPGIEPMSQPKGATSGLSR